jgi:hypothetical protein
MNISQYPSAVMESNLKFTAFFGQTSIVAMTVVGAVGATIGSVASL